MTVHFTATAPQPSYPDAYTITSRRTQRTLAAALLVAALLAFVNDAPRLISWRRSPVGPLPGAYLERLKEENEMFTNRRLVSAMTERPVMHVFFEKIDKKGRFKDEIHLLDAWEKSWQAAGWETRILTLKDAQAHPDYDDYVDNMKEVPLGGNPEFDRYCYLRWLAMGAVGGGWMSDIDVFPLRSANEVRWEVASGKGIIPSDPDDLMPVQFAAKGRWDLPEAGKFVVHTTAVVPCLMSGSADEWTRMAHLILADALRQKEGYIPFGKWVPLWSDMMALQSLKKTPGLFSVKPGTLPGQHVLREKIFTEEDCQKTQGKRAVHFSTSVIHLAKSLENNERTAEFRPKIAMRWLKKWSGTCSASFQL